MADGREAESLFWPRLRWRLRGALQWPLFMVLTVVDAVLLERLPVDGERGTGYVGGLLLAGFFNLAAVAVLAPLSGVLLRRRRRDLPKVVADDYAGTVLLLAVTAAILTGGLVHRPARLDAQRDLVAQQAAAQRFIAHRAPREFRRGAEATSSVKLQDELFRTCAPGPDPDRWFCVFVDTEGSPPGITVDDNRESNASFRRAGGFR
jgi:hypothetical protein